jgi:hypothetical protein
MTREEFMSLRIGDDVKVPHYDCNADILWVVKIYNRGSTFSGVELSEHENDVRGDFGMYLEHPNQYEQAEVPNYKKSPLWRLMNEV